MGTVGFPPQRLTLVPVKSPIKTELKRATVPRKAGLTTTTVRLDEYCNLEIRYFKSAIQQSNAVDSAALCRRGVAQKPAPTIKLAIAQGRVRSVAIAGKSPTKFKLRRASASAIGS